MEVENLTTGEDSPQVNVEEQTSMNVDDSLTNDVPVEENTDTNDSEYSEAYNNVWDKDVNDIDVMEFEESTTVSDPLQVEESFEDTSTNGTNNSIGAFMSERPVLKYKGQDVPIDSANELIALAQKGFSYETEMSNIKPKKKVLSIVDGVPLETLQAIADLHSGKKDAINYLKSQYGIVDTKTDTDDFFSDNEDPADAPADNYQPTVKADDPIMDFWNEYSTNDQVGAAKVNEIYQGLNESFKADVYRPGVFQAFVASVTSGEFDQVYPMAVKEKTLNPAMSWIQAYQLAVQKNGVQTNAPTEPPAAATPPRSEDSSRNLSSDAAADRVWNDPEYFKQLEAKIFS